MGRLNIRPGLRIEIFEQERIDRLNGSSYQDQTEAVILPGLGMSANIYGMKFFGGIHRGYTPPSSGALNIDMILVDYIDNGLDVLPEKSWNKEIGVKGRFPIIFNLSLNYKINQKIDLFLSGKNITDKVYIGSRLHSNPLKKDPSTSSGIIPGARRQINIGIEYTF